MDTAATAEEELARARSTYRNQGRWGADDALGTLNFLDNGKRAHAASLVRRGRPVSLAGVGARWHLDGHRPESFSGRGVLLDVARAVAGTGGELADGFAIREEHLLMAVEAQGATSTVRRGDIVLVRTGQPARCRRLGDWTGYASGPAPGLSFSTLGWLHGTDIAAAATDTAGFEVRPYEFASVATAPLRQIAVTGLGLPLGAKFDLEELAEDCAADGVYEFLLVAAPLPVTGGDHAPVNPIAIK
jgi:kynurenine formamidase